MVLAVQQFSASGDSALAFDVVEGVKKLIAATPAATRKLLTGALDDIFMRHKVMPSGVEVAAAAIKAGVNLDCSNVLQNDVEKAIEQKLLTEKDIDSSLAHLLRTQFRLGFYDDPTANPFYKYGADSVANAAHAALARAMAQPSITASISLPSISITCQPKASHLARRSSSGMMDSVGPSIWMLLRSVMAIAR